MRVPRTLTFYGLWDVLISVALGFSCYALLSFGISLAQDEVLSASMALWIPNLASACVAIPLPYRARRAER